MKTRWKITLAAVVIAIIGALLLMPSGSYRRELAAYKRDLQAKGEKITLAELWPARSTTNMSPGATLFMALTNFGMGTIFPVRFAPGQTNLTAQQQADYSNNVQIVARLRTALAAGQLDFNLDYSQGDELLLPHVGQLKRATQYAAGTAAQALSLKDYPEAWADLLVTVDLLRLWHGEPIMLCDLVRVSDMNASVPVMIDALEERVWTDAQLADLQARWDSMDFFSNAEPTLAVGLATLGNSMDMLRNSPEKLQMYSSVQASGGSGFGVNAPRGRLAREIYGIFWRIRMFGWKNTWSYDEELRYSQVTLAAKEVAQKALKTGAFVPAYEPLDAQFANINNSHTNASKHFELFQPGGESAVSRYLTRLADAEVYRRLVVTAIALERYRLARASYPARLEELSPEYLKVTPMDFMDGKPLRYRLQPDGDYLLYSVGLDGKDDGGTNDRIWPRPSLAK